MRRSFLSIAFVTLCSIFPSFALGQTVCPIPTWDDNGRTQLATGLLRIERYGKEEALFVGNLGWVGATNADKFKEFLKKKPNDMYEVWISSDDNDRSQFSALSMRGALNGLMGPSKNKWLVHEVYEVKGTKEIILSADRCITREIARNWNNVVTISFVIRPAQ